MSPSPHRSQHRKARLEGDEVEEVEDPRIPAVRVNTGCLPPLAKRNLSHRAAGMTNSRYFFCGIGGSGMLPLASIVRASGAACPGSDRSLDAGRTAPQVRLFALAGDRAVPAGRLRRCRRDDARYLRGGRGDHSRRRPCPGTRPAHLTRPQFLAQLLNPAQRSVAVGGTSGKSTVTGMIGWILHACHRQPTVMNGAVMKNFVTPLGAFATPGWRSRAVRQRGRRKRRLDRALPPRSRGADQHQPRPQGDGRAARPVRRLPQLARARRSSTSTIPKPGARRGAAGRTR